MGKTSKENDLRVLAPKTVTWEIGDQTFEQAPATLDQLADVMDVIVDEVLSSGKGELLEKLMDTATAVEEGESSEKAVEATKQSVVSDRDMLMSLIRIIATLPRAMPRIAAAILEAPEDYLRARDDKGRPNLRPKQAFGIIRTFVQQNDVGSIIRDFFGLFQELKAEMSMGEDTND